MSIFRMLNDNDIATLLGQMAEGASPLETSLLREATHRILMNGVERLKAQQFKRSAEYVLWQREQVDAISARLKELSEGLARDEEASK